MQKNNLRSIIIPSTALFITSSVSAMVVPDRRDFPINPDINPCENFYEYSCSKVISSFQLPEDRARHTFSFSDPNERILEYKKKYFANLANIKPEGDRELQLKNYYQACMNPAARVTEEKQITNTAVDLLGKIKSREELLNFFGSRILSPEGGAVAFGTDSNQDRPTWNDVYFDIPFMSLPETTYYQNAELMKAMESLYASFFKTIGATEPVLRAKNLINFEKGLADVYPTPTEFRDIFSSRTQVTQAQLLSQYPNLKLKEFLARVPKSTHIRHVMPKAMKYLNDSFATVDIQTLKDAYLFFTTSGYWDDAYPDFFKERFDFTAKYLGGANTRPDRHERCTKMVMSHFPMEIDSILWPRLFPNFPRAKFVEMAEKVRASLLTMLEANTWLGPKAKQEAIRKIKTAPLQLVSPLTDEEWDFKPKAEYSNELAISNMKKRSQLLTEKELTELKGPISTKRWGMGPLTINAYYSASYNKFVLPVGILQYPFYDPNQPESLNLAAIGAVIGHELGHAIDDKGSRYDADGLLKPWMNPHNLSLFKERSGKLVGQFNKAGHNGELTLGENIGDLVGLTTAYRAAFGSVNPKAEDLKVRKQEFYISFARVWCGVQRPSYTELQLKTDPHSLGWARVNEQMKLQPAFQEAFACKDTDKMVLPDSERVKIWW